MKNKQHKMMKKILFLALLLPLTLGAQTVIIPNRYSFQKEDNQYQLNVLTKFLLEKQGFTTYMESEVPAELLQNPCNALKADVKNESNMMTSKLQLVLNDCTNKAVFTSEIGKSREKEYKKSYQEALRNTFAGTALSDFKKKYTTTAATPTAFAATNSDEIIISAVDVVKTKSLYAKKATHDMWELYDTENNELLFKLRATLTPNVYVAYAVKGKSFGIAEKDGSTFYKLTFYNPIEGSPATVVAQIKFD